MSQRREEREGDEVNVGRVFQTDVKQISESLGAKERMAAPEHKPQTGEKSL